MSPIANTHRFAAKLLKEAREREHIEDQLREQGYTDHNRAVRGFIPHWQRGSDLVFITNASYYIGRILQLKKAYRGYGGKVYVVVTSAAPPPAVRDLLATKVLIPLNTDLVPYTLQGTSPVLAPQTTDMHLP